MKPLTPIKNRNDEDLVYNEKTKQYELTISYVKNNFEVTYSDDEVLKKRILKNSRVIYRYIKDHCYSRNRPLIERLLANTEEGRQFIFEMLSTQIEADLETGYNDLSSAPAVNLSNGQVIPREELRRNQVTVDTEQVFDRSSDYFGFHIGYMAAFPYAYYVFFRRV